METALLARGFVILVAVLIDRGVLDDDPLSKELRAIAQTYQDKTRAQVNYHETPRGARALTKADAPPES